MSDWLEKNPEASRIERLRRYAGIEILLYLFGWFPDKKLPFKQVTKQHSFLWWNWESNIKEPYKEMMDRLIKEYKSKN